MKTLRSHVQGAFHEAKEIDSLGVAALPEYSDSMPADDWMDVYYLVRARDGAGNLAEDSNRVGLFPFQVSGLRLGQ